MTKTAVIGGAAAAAVAAAVATTVALLPPKSAPVVPPTEIQCPALGPADCQELRGFLERDFAMRMRAERRTILKDAAAVVRAGLKAQRVRNPKAAPPPGVEELVHDLDRRAAE